MSRTKFIVSPCLLTLLALGACTQDADDGDMQFSTSGGDSIGETGGDEGMATSTTSGDSTVTGATTTDDGGTTTDTGADDETTGSEDPPLPCDFALGCHTPQAPDSSVGLASHVPVGCEGDTFTMTTVMNVSMFADPEAPRSVPHIGDFDGDGAPDIVLNFRKASVGYVLRGNGDGTFDTTSPSTLTGGLFAGGWGGDLGDIDNDGDLDIVLGDHTRSARAWANGGGMSFTDARNGLPDNVWFNGAGVADFDGDGNLDAVFGADQFSSGYQMYYGDGSGNWTVAPAPSGGPSNAGYFAFDDYDGDGDPDMFSFSRGSQGNSVDANVYRNDGSGWSLVATLTNAGSAASSANPVQGSVGDVNCDGITDVAVGGSIYLGNGSGWTKAADVDLSHISHLADMNGDGNLDLITSDPSVGLALYIGDGTGAGWTLDESSGLGGVDHTPSGFAFNTPYGIDVADLDGNDNLDVVRIGGFGSSFWLEAWTR